MQTDAQLIAQAFPDLDAVTDEARASWAPALHDTALRDEICATPKLAAWMLADLLAEAVSDLPDEPETNADLLLTLQQLLTCDTDRVATCAGLVWHANQLARLVSTNALALPTIGWDTGDVRFALRHRGRGMAPEVSDTSFVDAVARSGTACLAAWIAQAPERLRATLRLSASPLGDACRAAAGTTVAPLILSQPADPAPAPRRRLLPRLSRTPAATPAPEALPQHDKASLIPLCLAHVEAQA
ncbi:MAG: hypothetical protein AAFN94_15170 [Pseudomonadota bacterium]